MWSLGSGSAGAADEPPPRFERPPEPIQPRPLLEGVLRQTLEDSEAGEPLSPPTREALIDVARRHSGQPFSPEPIAAELVHAILSTDFRRLAGVPGCWRAAAVQIAQSLCEDPVAAPRLERLWDRLVRIA